MAREHHWRLIQPIQQRDQVVDDEDGEYGWGEVWCNFPAVGAEHRTRLINEMLGPMLTGRTVEHPSRTFDDISAAISVLALQSGEAGPFAQA